jgi:hypothetical protein
MTARTRNASKRRNASNGRNTNNSRNVSKNIQQGQQYGRQLLTIFRGIREKTFQKGEKLVEKHKSKSRPFFVRSLSDYWKSNVASPIVEVK